MNKGIIITGGRLDSSFALEYLKKELPSWEDGRVVSNLIAADKAVLFCQEAGIVPGHIVGDFDSAGTACLSCYKGNEQVKILSFRPEKDWTDTELAVRTALELGWDDITLLGATGSRIDHIFGSLQTLAMTCREGVDCRILDPNNKIYARDRAFTISRDAQWGRYVSFFAFNGPVEGLTIKGVRYPLQGFHLDNIGTLTVSNEITDEKAEVFFDSGILLVIESRD